MDKTDSIVLDFSAAECCVVSLNGKLEAYRIVARINKYFAVFAAFF